MWQEMQHNWETFVIDSTNAMQTLSIDIGADKQAAFNETDSYQGKTKTRAVQTRIGQPFFRRAVLSAYQSQCCISGISAPELLVASHIVPWSHDEMNRLNPRNGLCLSVLHDKTFDLGLISISESLTVMVSKKLRSYKDPFLKTITSALVGKPILKPEKFQPSKEFLAFHRETIFLG